MKLDKLKEGAIAKSSSENWLIFTEKQPKLKIFLSQQQKREKDIFHCVFSGVGVKKYFSQETGGHRIQRVPPTESKGRVHTSSVTVAVMEPGQQEKIQLKESEIRIETTRGMGNGGQHKNTTDSCVIITHFPTGIKVRRDGRDQHKNKEDALSELTKRVQGLYDSKKNKKESEERRVQIGTGFRGDKIRTYIYKSDLVCDHITGKKTSLKQIFKGNLKLLHI